MQYLAELQHARVDRRTGGLEIHRPGGRQSDRVDRRTGGLESEANAMRQMP